jgi:hypothetical protein
MVAGFFPPADFFINTAAQQSSAKFRAQQEMVNP